MSLVENKQIKIPEQHYVGFQNRDENLPLGFMTTEGTDAKSIQRKSKVDEWAKGSYHSRSTSKTVLPSTVINNKPMSGFKMGREIKRTYGWGKGTVQWRIEDPRGFELEISSPNLAQVIANCTIENGEILEKCVWGRLGVENILIPVSSDVYKSAFANTERFNKSASLRDLNVGNKIITQDGVEGIFLGNYYPIVYSGITHKLVDLSNTRRACVKLDDGEIVMIGSLKLSEIINSDIVTDDEAIQIINSGIANPDSNIRYQYSTVLGVVKKKAKYYNSFRKLVAKPLSSFIDKNHTSKHMIIKNSEDEFGIYRTYNLKKDQQFIAPLFDEVQFLATGEIKYQETARSNVFHSIFNYGRNYGTTTKHIDVDLKNETDYTLYSVEYTFKNKDEEVSIEV